MLLDFLGRPICWNLWTDAYFTFFSQKLNEVQLLYLYPCILQYLSSLTVCPYAGILRIISSLSVPCVWGLCGQTVRQGRIIRWVFLRMWVYTSLYQNVFILEYVCSMYKLLYNYTFKPYAINILNMTTVVAGQNLQLLWV